MKKLNTLLLFLLTSPIFGYSQNLDGFDALCKQYIKETIKIATSTQLKFELDRDSTLIILDAREKKEYDISHIPNAIYVGYDKFSIEALPVINKNSKIYVYCSIGYRSEKIGEKLEAAGYSWVLNLYGGIFDWANNKYPLVDSQKNKTNKVHGYDKNWSKWINTSTCTRVVD